ncbi:SDR family NAD(P)-dependent oxidoreductase [Poseidonocella sp. HB161398]|uniref:SDR family NAD(P)-dependent oxidoreductase n=1 Tax=Poseidonocella sp. HB161398 TaxID=2320855 RepID=UPI001981E800|nr:SDR family oxidoreductase [Poseidonocella sp. HB161398]
MILAPDSLAGQSILVTGATGGIGQAITLCLAAAGARVGIHYAANSARAESLLQEIGGAGWIVQGDLSTREGPTQLWEDALAAAGRIDGMVMNAGLRTRAEIGGGHAAWRDAWELEMAVNLLAPADLLRAALPHFRETGSGRIVSIASRAAQRGYMEDYLPYGASKAALINLTKSVARNWSKDGVIAVTVSPGFVHAGMADAYIAEHGYAATAADIPTGKLVSAEELAATVGFCLVPGNMAVNGATIDLNGGSYIR